MKPRLLALASFLVWSAIFGISYTQAALYYSNLNQYFLHALTHAGLGDLHQDCLANTLDPTPAFSAAMEWTYRSVGEYAFYVIYVLLLGVYFVALVKLYDHLTEEKTSRSTRLLFMTLVIALHAGLMRLASARLFGVDYPWYFQAGLAGQYILGFGLQPSVAGVFLLASIVAFVRGRPWFAIVLACLAGDLHGTYLLGAGMVVLAYLCVECGTGRISTALLQGVVALVLVAPAVLYNALTFAPTSADIFAESQRILAHVRIPHHSEPERWCDGISWAQIGWIVLGMILVMRSRLFVVMAVPAVLSALLTGVQLWTGSDTLALLFPWRISAILVPLATAIISTRLITLLDPWLARRSALGVRLTCGLILAGLVVGGITIGVFELGFRTNPTELPMMDYVKEHRQRGDLYLLPVSIPKGGKGAASTNFTPAPRMGKTDLIPIDLQRFRLYAGAPIYVDFKSIPYKDLEVLEWYRRLVWANDWFANGKCDVQELREHGITHVVFAADRDPRCPDLALIYGDGPDAKYRVYRVNQ